MGWSWVPGTHRQWRAGSKSPRMKITTSWSTCLSAKPASSTSSSKSPHEEDEGVGQPITTSNPLVPMITGSNAGGSKRRKMELMWCSGTDLCKDVIRERVVGSHNHVILTGPATGQVAYTWWDDEPSLLPPTAQASLGQTEITSVDSPPAVFILVREGDDELMASAAKAVRELCRAGVVVLLDPSTAAKMKYYHGVDDDRIHLFEARPVPGYGSNLSEQASHGADHYIMNPAIIQSNLDANNGPYSPDLICTMGGDGLLMHAGMMFQGPIPPVLCVSGGSMGFLAVFSVDEMVDAVLHALDMAPVCDQTDHTITTVNEVDAEPVNVFPPNMPSYPYRPLNRRMDDQAISAKTATDFEAPLDRSGRICLSIRMRLECSVVTRDGTVKARYNVLNEVVVDRGCSEYLSSLDCFVDNVHLTTIQADGVIFATPTGSTAYSLAAGSSLVHPAVPAIVLTPICPHVLSFRPMVFPDSVVLRCMVPFDARSEAIVAFDGKHRQELRRGDSIQIRMSPYPVPTINRRDHSSDWMDSLKRNFNFNERPRQRPLRRE